MAKRLAERKAKEQGAKAGCVNMYTFDDSTIFDMEMFCFDPSYETWRAIVDGDLLIGDVDLVRGPAIDETSHKQLFLFEGGVADVSMLKPEQVKKCEPVRQFLFCSERAAASLTFTGFEKFRLKE